MRIEKTIALQEVLVRRRFWTGLLKVLLVVWLCYTLYWQVVIEAGTTGVWPYMAGLWPQGWPWLLAATCLMPLNWVLEALKWRALMAPFAPLGFLRTLKGVLAGVSFSQLTPNRIGEYGGRLAVLPVEQYGAGVAASLVGSLAQWLALLSGGLAGLLYLSPAGTGWHYATLATIGILIALAIAYFAGARLAALMNFALSGRLITLVRNKLSFLAPYPQKILWRALLLACARYAVYVAQYALLIKAVNLPIPPDSAVSGIALIYLLQTGIPVPPLAAVLTRGELAIWLWESYNIADLGILTASFALFIINLGVPALLGAAIIVRTKDLKKEEDEEKKLD